jgi:hypothetical protein
MKVVQFKNNSDGELILAVIETVFTKDEYTAFIAGRENPVDGLLAELLIRFHALYSKTVIPHDTEWEDEENA